jgi:hypothetical protein
MAVSTSPTMPTVRALDAVAAVEDPAGRAAEAVAAWVLLI